MDEHPDNVAHHLLLLDVVEPLVQPKPKPPERFPLRVSVWSPANSSVWLLQYLRSCILVLVL